MYIPFNQLSQQSNVWIYASKTAFSSEQVEQMSGVLKEFTDTWQAHGVELKASYEIKHNHFIVIAVDELFHAPSGCSIDKSVQIIKNIESEFGFKLMDRMVVYILENGSVKTYPITKITEAIQEGVLLPDSQCFDNTITSLNRYNNEWVKEAQNTWLNRYFVHA